MTPTTEIDSESHAGKRPGVKAWLLLSPLLAWLLLLVVLPTLTIVVFSFCRRGPLGSVAYDFTLDNYRQLVDRHGVFVVAWSGVTGLVAAVSAWSLGRVIARPDRAGEGTKSAFISPSLFGLAAFWTTANILTLGVPQNPTALPWLKITVVSVNYALAATVICVILGYPVAYFIAKAPARWRGLLLLSVMIPFWTSFLVRTYAWVTILRQGGLFNTMLLKLGLISDPLDLYPSSTGVMIGLVYTYLPFMILPIYTSIERLDNSLIEAALDLGASPLRAFKNVILPLTRPGIVAGVVLVFVPAVGMFAVNDILGGRREMLLGNLIERQFIIALDKPFGSAIGMLLLVLFVVTYAMSQRRGPA